jgi:hypothetical protein
MISNNRQEIASRLVAHSMSRPYPATGSELLTIGLGTPYLPEPWCLLSSENNWRTEVSACVMIRPEDQSWTSLQSTLEFGINQRSRAVVVQVMVDCRAGASGPGHDSS